MSGPFLIDMKCLWWLQGAYSSGCPPVLADHCQFYTIALQVIVYIFFIHTWESFMMLVTSGWILLAIPKSINLSEAFTMTKFAGFKSLWTIPTRPSTVSVKNRDSYCNILKHILKKKKNHGKIWDRKTTMFVNGMDSLQHVLPVELSL